MCNTDNIFSRPQENIKQYIKEHLDWGVGNIKRASLGKHFERNQWRLKPKKELDEGSAATVIQSGFRAKRSRQRVKKVRRAKNNEYDDECELAAVKMQTVARGRQSRKRVKKIKHKKEMEAMGFVVLPKQCPEQKSAHQQGLSK